MYIYNMMPFRRLNRLSSTWVYEVGQGEKTKIDENNLENTSVLMVF